MLEIKNLTVTLEQAKILQDISFNIKKGEIHFVMGPNGAGKSTLSQVIAGSPSCEIKGGSIIFNKKKINNLEADKRAKLGIFLAFQHPLELEGVRMLSFLKESKMQMLGKVQSPVAIRKEASLHMDKLGMENSFLDRYLNFGFSGGEKKKSEILQALMLRPKLAVLDEIDSGLDVDSLKLVVNSIKKLKKTSKTAFLVITHLPRLASVVTPDFVHIMIGGKIVESGDKKLINLVKKHGYKYFEKK